MAHPGIRSRTDELMSDLDAYRTAPVLSKVKPGPNRECDSECGKRDRNRVNKDVLRNEARLQPAERIVVVEYKIESQGDRKPIKQARTKWCALLRLFCAQPGYQPDKP